MNMGHAWQRLVPGALAFALLLMGGALSARADSSDKAQVQALEEHLAAALAAKDVDKVMQFYAPGDDLFVFDVIPPRQYVGAAAYRKDFEGFFSTALSGPTTVKISDLDIDADGQLAFAHYTNHMVSTDKSGAKVDMVVRTTDCLRKINGKWLIVHEHNSFPVELPSGKGDLMSKQ